MEKPKFVYVTYIKTTPEKLFQALTDPEFTKQYWMGTLVESDWKVGSPMRYRWKGGEISDEGVVLQCEPPRLLSYTFHHILFEELRGEKASRVTFEIEPLGGDGPGLVGDAVRLTVTHDDFDAGSKVFPKISTGWPTILSSLKSLLETGRSLGLDKK